MEIGNIAYLCGRYLRSKPKEIKSCSRPSALDRLGDVLLSLSVARFLGVRSEFVTFSPPLFRASLGLRSRCSLAVRGYFLTLRSRFVVCCSSSQGVVVAPEVVGLYGKLAQYLAIACAIFWRVVMLSFLPVLAAAILSFCCCVMSLRHTLLAIVHIFYIAVIVHIINIVHIGKSKAKAKYFRQTVCPVCSSWRVVPV